jgi:1-acyl-sn-glycerol-3-phosphate acyltransferase
MYHALSKFLLRVFGWKITGQYPDEVKKFILIVVPHTSNWDFPLGIIVRGALKKDIKFLGKSSLFKPPFGWFFRALGGYPVDRSKSTNLVDAVVDIFNEKEEFVVTIAPEGTRSKVDRLRTGFYYIALGAKIPILLVTFDFEHKEVRIIELFYPTGDKEKDFDHIHQAFKGIKGRHPEKSFGL